MTIAETAKKNPWKAVMAVLGFIGALIPIIYFAYDISTAVATKDDIKAAREDIVNELRDESAKLRVLFLYDLEERLEDVEISMEKLMEEDKNIPESTRRKAKRLQRRIEDMSGGS